MEIERIVLAVDDMAAMVEFYNAVFDSDLTPLGEPDSFHLGRFLGTELLMCPNEIASVDATQNRHQYRIAIGDLDGRLASARRNGGSIMSEEQDGTLRLAGIRDPDGNTYELVERS